MSLLNSSYKIYSHYPLWRHFLCSQKRCKHKSTHWSVISKKTFPIDRALQHYDDFYKTVFGKNWPSIRIALLSPHKYCAIVNNYSDTEQIITDLENHGALNMRRMFEIEAEKINDSAKTDERKKDMEKIYALDKKLESLMHSKKQEELESLYPPNDSEVGIPAIQSNKSENKEQISTEDLKQRSVESLRTSLEQAEFDEHRMIDPASGLSAAGLYEFIPATKLKGLEDWVPESQHYSYYKESDFPVTVKEDIEMHFPEHLNIYTFERSNVSSFPSPRRGTTGVLGYYLMDGSSVLPVLALGLQPNDRVLDMCSAPGGKALVMLQTLYPACVVCNDSQESRTMRIRSVLQQYLYNMEDRSKEVVVTHQDGRLIEEKDVYNKILVDVPCTTDRHSVHENDNNIFKPTRTKERLKLPEVQADLLYSALKLICPGGTVVYSTCSLSPIQNDGVVHMALRKVWEETKIQLEVRDMTRVLRQTQSLFNIGGRNIGLKYGHLVIPFLPNNFGPLYFCKIVRTL